MNNEFMSLLADLLKYVNSNNIEEFVSMIENMVQLAEKIEEDIQSLSKK